jgi:hypothetical protein
MPIADKLSFLAGLQLGRRLKILEARKKLDPPVTELALLTELEDPILTEDGEEILLED